jgi:hypothetical protein
VPSAEWRAVSPLHDHLNDDDLSLLDELGIVREQYDGEKWPPQIELPKPREWINGCGDSIEA